VATSSAVEEFSQRRYEHLGGHDMLLALQNTEPPVRQGVGDLIAYFEHPFGASPADEAEGLGPHVPG
jgi:hypothetical protein